MRLGGKRSPASPAEVKKIRLLQQHLSSSCVSWVWLRIHEHISSSFWLIYIWISRQCEVLTGPYWSICCFHAAHWKGLRDLTFTVRRKTTSPQSDAACCYTCCTWSSSVPSAQFKAEKVSGLVIDWSSDNIELNLIDRRGESGETWEWKYNQTRTWRKKRGHGVIMQLSFLTKVKTFLGSIILKRMLRNWELWQDRNHTVPLQWWQLCVRHATAIIQKQHSMGQFSERNLCCCIPLTVYLACPCNDRDICQTTTAVATLSFCLPPSLSSSVCRVSDFSWTQWLHFLQLSISLCVPQVGLEPHKLLLFPLSFSLFPACAHRLNDPSACL